MMKIAIIGSGIAGVPSAYFLAKAGCQVVLLDQHPQAAQGSSYANGGQLSYRYPHPIASPSVLKQLPGILLGLNPVFKVYPSLDWNFYRWGIQFLQQCSARRSQQASALMQQLGGLSRACLHRIVDETGIAFDFKKASGKVFLYRDQQQLADELALVGRDKFLSVDELTQHIPDIVADQSIVGGVFYQDEDAGDCSQFCRELLAYLQQHYSVEFLPTSEVKHIQVVNNKVEYIESSQGRVMADHYVVAAGAYSAALMKTLDIYLPIYPIKGYSITVPAGKNCPSVSVTDTDAKMVYCRLGEHLRIAGFAELSGYETAIKQKPLEWMLHRAKKTFPHSGDYQMVLQQWCGLRPATPDSLPIVGQSEFSNLWLNTGHGMLGWTYAAATAQVLESLMLGRAVGALGDCLSLGRF